MKSPTYLSQPAIERLPNILEQLQSGEILIPRFQRPFVWTDDQRLLLLRSVYQRMPIGSILVWRTRDHELKIYNHLGSHPLNSSGNRPDQIKQYLLDGHQRLTTLYTALSQGATAGSDGEGLVAPELENRRPLYFDLIHSAFELEPRRSNSIPPTWLPMSIILDPFKLYSYQKEIMNNSKGQQAHHWVNRIESLSNIFKDYTIPVVPIVSEDFDVVTESFTRVNRAGTSMDEVHMLSALTWSQDFDLKERMTEIRTELGEVGWGGLEDKWILNTCKAALDLDIYDTDTKAIRDAIRDEHGILESATSWLKEMALFLSKNCNVFGPEVLPYRFQAVLLADALRLATDELSKEISTDVAEKLRRWFWLTTYTEYFGGISASRLKRSLIHVRRVVTAGESPHSPDLPEKVNRLGRFDFRAARSRAVSLRLAELTPLDADQNSLDVPQLLAEYGKDAAPMLIPSSRVSDRSISEGVENRLISHPKDAMRLRKFILDPQNSLFADTRSRIRRSHAIDREAEDALSCGDRMGFFESRRDRILDLERTFIEQLGLQFDDR